MPQQLTGGKARQRNQQTQPATSQEVLPKTVHRNRYYGFGGVQTTSHNGIRKNGNGNQSMTGCGKHLKAQGTSRNRERPKGQAREETTTDLQGSKEPQEGKPPGTSNRHHCKDHRKGIGTRQRSAGIHDSSLPHTWDDRIRSGSTT